MDGDHVIYLLSVLSGESRRMITLHKGIGELTNRSKFILKLRERSRIRDPNLTLT